MVEGCARQIHRLRGMTDAVDAPGTASARLRRPDPGIRSPETPGMR